MSGEKELLEVCGISADAALARLGTTDRGLTDEQVLELRAKHGLNEIAKRKKLGFLGEIFQRCKNPLVIQLFVIASLSYAMGDAPSALIVGLMIFLSVFLVYVQET